MRTTLAIALFFATTLVLTTASALPAGWPNGDFELGDAGWTYPASTVIGDADDSGDQEAFLLGSGAGTWQISRGVSKAALPANVPLSFVVEKGTFTYDVRMILLSAANPDPWANNLFYLDPTGTLQPDWTDDHILSWAGTASSQTVVLDPVEANAFNIPGWEEMTAEERAQELATYLHMTIVVYGHASGFEGGATLDDFSWVL